MSSPLPSPLPSPGASSPAPSPGSSSPAASPAPSQRTKPQDVQLNRARSSLKQTLNRYNAYFKALQSQIPGTQPLPAPTLRPHPPSSLARDMERLSVSLEKLEQKVFRIAVFGLVSRGKSALLNALVGEKILQTGPLNGVTLEPQTLRWRVDAAAGGSAGSAPEPFQVELIDTPGLDEIDGQARAEMARSVARRADLILFVVSGDITRTEYQALCDLRLAQKPLLLVFNKIDLYPDQTRQDIFRNLQTLAARSAGGEALQDLLSADEIVLVAAEPTPLQVRVEQPDGSFAYEREVPPPNVRALRTKLIEILHREGSTLLALNALVQSRDGETQLTDEILQLYQPQADVLIGQYARYKGGAIALNPIPFLDIVGGILADLALIRALADLYGLPLTRHEALELWKAVFLSLGSQLLTQLGSSILLGVGKGLATTGLDGGGGLAAYATAGVTQGAIAAYGTYTVGKAVQIYLQQGCSWGPQGANTVIHSILDQVDSKTLIYRLRQEISQDLGLPGL